MAIQPYLAMTGAEIRETGDCSSPIAWMSCRFSDEPWGVENLPEALPADSLLILDDSIPFRGQDPDAVFQALESVIGFHSCRGLLLDFQRPGNRELPRLIQKLLSLPCPVAVSDLYAGELSCPVFLPPVPLHRKLSDHIAPWHGRGLWLDISPQGQSVTVTEQGSVIRPLPGFRPVQTGFEEQMLHCHYCVDVHDHEAVFTLWRTREDLRELVKEAENCGVAAVIGLYQELGALE